MAAQQSNEDNLVTFLSGFNQVFLSCLLVNIIIETSLGGGSNKTIMDDDYDFELNTALERSKNHSTVVAGLVVMSIAAVVFITMSRVVQNARRMNLSVLDVSVYH
eukprot:TRINITY_DN23476_c0_g1_i1.p2 TRINITY_DN23476_c0_g1~~TRINITY_DN23476_c0_g1_i1.p2  ORF type:complete len:105 (-),score=38.94 TRINITY_DN23476_c0_g1_i1:65-379(-)